MPGINHYDVVEGADLVGWIGEGVFRAPGGEGAPLSPVRGDDGLFRVSLPRGSGLDERPDAAWDRAQAAERAFWRGWRGKAVYQSLSLEAYWREVVEKTGGTFAPGRYLDVGCGPVSVLNFVRPPGVRGLGIDPLAAFYRREGLVESHPELTPVPMASLPAERLPFADHCFDAAICFNVLDHVQNPQRVLAEIARVTRPGGAVRVFVHTFSRFARKLLFFDTPHVNHWHRAEFRRLLEGAGLTVVQDRHERKRFDVPRGFLNALSGLPYRLAAQIMFTDYYLLAR